MEYSDDAPSGFSQGFVYALLISLLVHALLTVYFADRDVPRAKIPVRTAPAQPLRFRLLPRQVAAVAQEIERSTKGKLIKTKSGTRHLQTPTTASKDDAADAKRQPVRQEPSPTLDLDLSVPLLDQPPLDVPPSARSATVFDQRLAGTLKEYRVRADARSHPTFIPDGSDSRGSNGGGRWQSFVKIGKLCFEVIAADPLDSVGTDQWFARDCD